MAFLSDSKALVAISDKSFITAQKRRQSTEGAEK
jgi:hypothetical protein